MNRELTIVGLGPGAVDALPIGVLEALRRSGTKNILRTEITTPLVEMVAAHELDSLLTQPRHYRMSFGAQDVLGAGPAERLQNT
nr:hypothetical protein [Bacillota bacterium]